jgi:hypothetical protein
MEDCINYLKGENEKLKGSMRKIQVLSEGSILPKPRKILAIADESLGTVRCRNGYVVEREGE